MRQVFQKIPVYTGDVSGVCSALYELGGMVVMHDPSGCNSTYNTHDEIRWYDRDSLIFLSGLDEMDAIMGNDDRLIHDIAEAAKIYSPEFIAIVNSPIPYIIGEDFDAVCRMVEKKTGIPAFYVSTNGMHDYVRGAGLAFLRIAEQFAGKPGDHQREGCFDEEQPTGFFDSLQKEKAAEPVKKDMLSGFEQGSAGGRRTDKTDEKIRCNILGITPLDFAAGSTLDSLYKKISGAGMEVVSCWAMSSPESSVDLLDGIRRSHQADVTLLLSSTGMLAAQYLQEKFGIPFVAGLPCDGVEDYYFDQVREAVRSGENRFPYRNREGILGGKSSVPKKRRQVCLIGEPVIMTSLAASIEKRTGACTHVYGATEGSDPFLGMQDAALSGEEELNKALKDVVRGSRDCGCRAKDPVSGSKDLAADSPSGFVTGLKDLAAGGLSGLVKVVADPCYEKILPEGCELVRFPHLAFSGRIFLRGMLDLAGGTESYLSLCGL